MSTQAERLKAVDIRDAIHTWPEREVEWWRDLLGAAPREALLVGDLAATLSARPIDTHPENAT